MTTTPTESARSADAALSGGPALPAARGGCPFAPPPAYEEAHRTAPVTRAPLWDGSSCWLVTGHAQVRTVLSDNRFSADARHPGFPFLSPGRRELVNRATPSFLRLDGAEHARQRRMLTGDFIVKRVEAMRPRIQRIVDDALDRMVAEGSPADLVAAFALPVPSLVICHLLGVPYEDHGFFQSRSGILLDIAAPAESVGAAQRELTGYLTELTGRKRREPDDSLLGRLAARPDVSPEEAAATGLLLLVAGHETTANMTALGTLALLRHPEQAARLRAEPGLVKGAVEELLRWLSVVHLGVPRVAVEDVDLDGTVVRAGEGVLCMVSTANRDAAVFTDGDRLDLGRDARRHFAFGFGVHQCLGQPLARAELQIALETLFRRLPGLRLAVPYESVRYRADMVVYGVQELPVAW
ncbi:cytochrome P450 [Kitasatospora sp. DSM 101779]|uniref:cytochrome P450 n=1 Tax=Kitasatospora sp. DSM 101779 TaxID=2853165 RepID=UPI0021D9D7D1|nr:cytochrome P450 [Kitasatospora sp. DSM 101779]MCU7820534.1 cytochrome P450 [Kitasatospora sp. DSM 101779]